MNWLTKTTTGLVMWTLLSTVEGQADGNFWWLTSATDAPPDPTVAPAEQPSCECVKYYLCVNGTISTSGVGIIDVRIRPQNRPPPPRVRDAVSVTECPDLYDVCCAPPAPLTTTTTTAPQPTLPPDTPCKCVSFVNCTADRLVSNGGGNTSLEALGLNFSHSSCPHAFTVCCALEPTTAAPNVTAPSTLSPSHCDCVEPYMCDATGTIITSGAGLIDLRSRFRNPNPHIECEDQQKICCNKPPQEEASPATEVTTTTTTQVPSTTPLITTPNCGTRNEMGIAARILGFKEGESQFGEYPWVTAVLRQEVMMSKTFHLFVGGGTLIHSRVVITAAHKVRGIQANTLWVRLGEWDTQTEYEAHSHQNVQVEEIVIHPNFDPIALYNDIALLFLKEEAWKAPNINHICVAEDLKEVNGSACVINGWGKNGFEEGGEYQKIMKSLNLPLVNQQTCQTRLRTTRLGKYFRLHNSFLCAGGELGKDACTGDGGGPLACPRVDDPTRYLLVGITAWGIGCGQDGIPGVYASIPANYYWIRNETHKRYPPPASTTTTTTTTTTITTTEPRPTPENEDYYYQESSAEEWGDRRNQKNKKQLERERRRKEKNMRKQRREERKRRREERRWQELENQD